jgi:hypothetical protein
MWGMGFKSGVDGVCGNSDASKMAMQGLTLQGWKLSTPQLQRSDHCHSMQIRRTANHLPADAGSGPPALAVTLASNG